MAIALICTALVAYDAARCRMLSITHDEALTYVWHVTGGIRDIILFNTPGLPDNNHVLFTLLAKLSVFFFGDSELALRLPSLLAYGLFCAAVAAIISRQVRGSLSVLCLLFIVLNPYIVDMMSIARGYGLGIALSMAGTWCLLRDSEQECVRPAWWSGWAAACFGCAVLSNLIFLPMYTLALGVMVLTRLDAWQNGRTTMRRAAASMTAPALFSAALAPLLIRQIRMLRGEGLLNIGGSTSFFADTVSSVVHGTLYLSDFGRVGSVLLTTFAYAVPIAALIIGAICWFRPKRSAAPANRDLLVVSILLVGTSLLSVLQHHLLGVAYLSGRHANFLYPLFGIAYAGLLAAVRHWRVAWRGPTWTILLAFPLVMLVHFGLAANLRTTLDWPYDSQTKTMMSDIERLLPRNGPQRYRFGISWQFEPAVNYYLHRNGWTSVAPVTRAGPYGSYDLYYVSDDALANLRSAVEGLTIVRHYARSQATLLIPHLSQ